MVQLDFTLNSSAERKDYADKYIADNPDKRFSEADLETIANYILYGKGADGESAVDKKEIQIKTKYNSYKKKEPESLDELMESPTFDERVFVTDKNRYKTIKPKIERDKDFDVPGIQELWSAIDYYQHIIDVNTGKAEPDPNVRTLSSVELYKMKHMIIDIRRQQFYLRDSVKPTIVTYGTSVKKVYNPTDNSIPWDLTGDSPYTIAPLGLLTGHDEKFYSPRTYQGKDYSFNKDSPYVLDFRNPDHIYSLYENYEDLMISCVDNPESTVAFILDTLDFYTNLAHLSDAKLVILNCKKNKVQNEAIKQKLNKEFGLTHSANYISTIWKQKICVEIAEAAQLHYDQFLNRDNPFAWKKCNQCGEFKLKDTRSFMRKSRSSDGLASRCKDCDKKNREKNK